MASTGGPSACTPPFPRGVRVRGKPPLLAAGAAPSAAALPSPPPRGSLVPRPLRRRTPHGPAGRRSQAPFPPAAAAANIAATGLPVQVRLAVAATSTVALLHNLWLHFGPLRAEHRLVSPASAGWGRESAFYTFHGNLLALLYATAAATVVGRELWLSWRGAHPAAPASGGGGKGKGWPLLEGAVYGWGGVPVTAVTLVVGIGYYGLIHFHPLYVLFGECSLGQSAPCAVRALVGVIESLSVPVDASVC